MFSKFGFLALLAAPLVSALTLTFPSNATSGGEVTITWTLSQDDSAKFDTFSFELINEVFNNAFAIANNVNPTAQTITLTLPVVPPGGGYTLQAVDVGNINNVFATSNAFSIAPAPTPLSSTVSVSSTNLSSLRASSTSVTSSGTSRSSSTSGSASASSLVVTSTPTNPSTSGSSATNSANTAGTTPFSGALSTRFGGSHAGVAAVLLSVAAGAAMIAL